MSFAYSDAVLRGWTRSIGDYVRYEREHALCRGDAKGCAGAVCCVFWVLRKLPWTLRQGCDLYVDGITCCIGRMLRAGTCLEMELRQKLLYLSNKTNESLSYRRGSS